MELRSKTSYEFKLLHAKLNDLGLYEKGMDLEQMRQVMGVVDESINETSFIDHDVELALRESERDFSSTNICNSTMIGLAENTNVLESSSFQHCQRSSGAFSTPYSSPDAGCVEKLTVTVEVHREMNWTPKKSTPVNGDAKRLSRKRTADAMSQGDSGVILSPDSSFESTNL